MEQATKFAETTQILMNVSEFTDVSQATDTLISAVQAFGYTAETSMDVVDLMNTIGNNYAISTADLAQSLTKSSASLVAAGGDLAEAAALTATANAVVQDADAVGTALKTTSLRLRGTSVKELEEDGLDTDGAIESTSKLQSKVKSLSGVDILTETGEYKSTYEILSQIADVWEDISNMDQAALLELLAGKRNASVLAAILQSPEELKAAYEDAQNSEGSALKENEEYLDSIQGKLDQLTNSMQTMWNNTLNSGFLKWLTDAGTILIKLIDKIGLFNTILAAWATIYMVKYKVGLIDLFGGISGHITGAVGSIGAFVKRLTGATAATSTLTAATLEQAAANGTLTTSEAIRQATTHGLVLSQVSLTDAEALALLSTTTLSKAEQEAIVAKLGLSSASKTLTLDTLQQAVADKTLTAAEALRLAQVTGLVSGEAALTEARAMQILTTNGVAEADAQAVIAALGLDSTTKTLTIDTIALALANGTLDPALLKTALSLLTVDGAAKGAAGGFAALWTAIWPMLALAGVALVIWGIVKAFDAAYTTTAELEEKLDNLNSEIAETKSELESLESELETTKERMEELLSMGSLSFVESEELNNLKLRNAELERNIALQEEILKAKEEERKNTAKELIKKQWDSSGQDKSYMRGANNEIVADAWHTAGENTKDLLDNAIASYAGSRNNYFKSQQILEQWSDDDNEANKELLIKYDVYGADNIRTEDLELHKKNQERIFNAAQANMTSGARGINKVLGDMAKIIDDNELSYSMGDEDINRFLDEYYAYSIKWAAAQGKEAKSSAISAIWDNTASDAMAELKKSLDETANSDAADKQVQAQGLIQDALDDTTGKYERLKTFMDTVGITAEEMAKYFIAASEAPNIETIDGLTEVYQDGVNILKQYGKYQEKVKKDMEALGKGGSVDLFNRPEVDASKLVEAGWEDAGEGIATVYSSTYSNEDGTIAMNFTPIMVDENGKHVGTLTPEELQEYAESVVAGAEDVKGLKIGATFNGEDALTEAEAAAERIHTLQEDYYLDVLGQDENGEDITWDNLFTIGDDGKKVADKLKIASILEGSDEAIREEFVKIVEAVENGEMDVNEAMSKFSLSGLIKIADMEEAKWAEINKSMFKGLDDEISGWIDSFSELGSALEDVASSMDLLAEANEQMANSGQISVKTALELMNSTDDWNKLLTIQDGKIRLNANAEEILVQSKLNTIKAQNAEALSSVNLQLAQMGAIDTAIVATEASDITTEAYAEYTKAMDSYSASIAGFQAAIGALLSGENPLTAYKNAREVILSQQENQRTVDVSQLREQKAALEEQKKMLEVIDEQGFENIYDFDENPGDKYDEKSDAFQKAMDYWENRIAANQARYEQLQNEIDLLDAKGQKADASYYKEQMKLENERLSLLQQQKAEAQKFLGTFAEGSEEWWDVASTLNDIESEIDSVAASIVDLQDAIGEIDTYKFEEFGNRLDNLISKLDTIRNLMAPNGEEDWFDENGNWTEDGVAVLGSYVQELEFYKQGLAATEEELNKYNKAYSNNTKAYYEALGIHSEQEYYDKVEELTDQQYDFAGSISDTEQSIVDMYESSIDAVEEYIETLIDSYNDYIDSVKEALDAERDLYEFKKNVQKQNKDIAELERRVSALSGSTNAADIAERRKLEAELYEAREGLNDTYYDHSKDTLNNALDAEQSAYEETMTKFVEGMRTSLETATQDMDTFLGKVTTMVSLNAGAILEQYQQTELPLDDALTNPWEAAKKATEDYSGNALDLMNQWTQNGFFTTTPEKIKGSLESPWKAGQTAVGAFKTSVDTEMGNVVTTIETNVKAASSKLSALYKQIEDTENRAANVGGGSGGGSGGGGTGGGGGGTGGGGDDADEIKLRGLMQTSKEMILGPKSFVDKNTETINGIKYYRDSKTGYYYKISDLNSKRKYDGGRSTGWAIPKGTWFYTKHAKGTVRTTRDEWAITDEPQFGDELVLVPTPQGNLSYMRKGTGVVPADLTANLMEWGQFTPDSLNLGGGVNVNMINNATIRPQYDFNFDSLVHVDHCDQSTIKDLEKMVDNKINDFSKQMNYSLKKFAR